MTDDEPLDHVLQDIFQALSDQAKECGLPSPEVVEGNTDFPYPIVTLELDDFRVLRAYVVEGLAVIVAQFWPVTMISIEELSQLEESLDVSDSSIEVHAIRDEDPRGAPEFWYEATSELRSEDVEIPSGFVESYLRVIEESEERVGRLEDAYVNQYYGAKLGAASVKMAAAIRSREGDLDRTKRMKAVIDEKEALLLETYTDFLDIDSKVSPVEQLLSEADEEEACLLLIDCAFSEPFAPYDIVISDDDRAAGLQAVASAVGFLDQDAVTALLEIRHYELGTQNALRDPKTAGAVLAAAAAAAVALSALVVVTGGAAAIGGLGPMGLAGAAATTHGLALLGGGSLAAGGLGMAGGLWIIGGTGALAAGAAVTAGGLGILALSAGPETARLELVKMQTSCAWMYFDDKKKTQEALKALDQSKDATMVQLDEELEKSDPESARIKNLKKTLKYIERAKESIASPGYDGMDWAFSFAERSKSKMGHFTRRAKRMLA